MTILSNYKQQGPNQTYKITSLSDREQRLGFHLSYMEDTMQPRARRDVEVLA